MLDPILIISPHTDDAELGCGGTISKFIEMKREVYLLALSTAEKSIPPGYDANSTKKEMFNACKILGLDENHIKIMDFEVRVFPQRRQEILDSLINIRNELNPKIIMVPSLKDTHQDHQVVTNESLRAFKKSSLSIYGYEQPWNCFTFDTQAFVELEESHIETKIQALRQYQTQANKEYFDPDFIKGLARTRGVTIGSRYAESFEIIKQIIL